MSRQKNIAVLGSTSVGKSALTLKYVHDQFPDYYEPTIINAYKKLGVSTNNSNIKYDLTVYDTAGLEQQSQIQTQYIDSNGFILVYSITDRQSFDIIQDIYEKLKEVLNGENKPVILIGNKIDLQANRRITFDEGKKLAKEMNAEFLETSAKLNNNVTDAFTTLLNAIDPPTNSSNNVNQQHQSNNNNSNNVSNKNSNTSNANSINKPLPRQFSNPNNKKEDKPSCIIT